MTVLRKSMNDCAKNFHNTVDFRPWGGIGKASATAYLINSIQNNQPSSYKLRLYFADKYAVLTYSVVDESQIVLPSSISMSAYKQNVHKSNMALLQIELFGSFGDFKGSYFSGKKEKGNPIVQLAGMSSLRHDGGHPFEEALIEFIDGKKAGKSAQALVRPLNKWLDKLETELSHLRDTMSMSSFICLMTFDISQAAVILETSCAELNLLMIRQTFTRRTITLAMQSGMHSSKVLHPQLRMPLLLS